MKAKAKFIRIAPRKARLVVDMVRNMNVDEALRVLRFTPKRAASVVYKLVQSAAANASEKEEGLNKEDLFVKEIFVDPGPSLRRFQSRAMGRATRILKRTSHITVILDQR